MTTRRKDKPRTIEKVIRHATTLALRKMVDDDGSGKVNDWRPDALSSWITPGIIGAVKRHLTLPPKGKAGK